MFTSIRTYTCTTVPAIDVMTGSVHPFTVEHDEGHIQAIRYDTGATVPPSSEQWTETALAFELDFERVAA